MNIQQPSPTVGEIAARYPASTRVFERLGIDFCCGGGVALSEACASRGVDAAQVLDEIRSSTAPTEDSTDWQSAPLTDLIGHILEKHHEYLRAHLPRTASLLEKVSAAHAERHGEMLRRLSATFQAMKEELYAHLMKEEQVLFPMIQTMEATAGSSHGPAAFHCGSVRNPIHVMVMEHDSAGEALSTLREITSGFQLPEDACNTFRALYFELVELERDLHRHIHLENNILFPRATALER